MASSIPTLLRANETTSIETSIILALELTLGIAGVIGNTIVCATIIGAKMLHNKTNFLLFCLASADLIVCSLAIALNTHTNEVISQHTLIKLESDTLGNIICREILCRLIVNKYIFWACCDSSINFLVAVTFERYLAIVHPFLYRRFFTFSRLCYLIVLIWLWSFAEEIYLPILFRYDSPSLACTYEAPNEVLKICLPIWGYVVTFCIPLIALLFMYLRIIFKIRASSEKHRRESRNTSAEQLSSASKKVVNILLSVTIAYVIFWTPCQIMFLLSYSDAVKISDRSNMLAQSMIILPGVSTISKRNYVCLL